MGWHVVSSFDGMRVIQVLRCDRIEGHFEVLANVGVRVFVNAQARRRMEQETMERASVQCLKLRQLVHNSRSD